MDRGGAAGMKYIANGKRHQQEMGARRWRPCLIKTNCRWARIFILAENRLELPSETLLQQSKSTSTHGRKNKKHFQGAGIIGHANKHTTYTKTLNSKAIIAHIVLIFLKFRGGQACVLNVEYECVSVCIKQNIKTVPSRSSLA